MTRCAVGLATLPRVLARHNDAMVVWLDAHGDLNVPDDTQTGYLGEWPFQGRWVGGIPGWAPACPMSTLCWSDRATWTPPRSPT